MVEMFLENRMINRFKPCGVFKLLIKHQGMSGHLKGFRSSLIASGGDDEWEIVGPKTKSDVTRTQNFLPSELSHIFGGQLRSVVKARGRTFAMAAK